MILNKDGERYNVNIPNHREVSKGVLLKEIRKSGLTVEQFIELLNR